jgi:hypothetical protein
MSTELTEVTKQEATVYYFTQAALKLGVELEVEAVGSYTQITLSEGEIVLVAPAGTFTHEGFTLEKYRQTDVMIKRWVTFNWNLEPTEQNIALTMGGDGCPSCGSELEQDLSGNWCATCAN